MAPCKYALLPFAAPATGTMDEGNEFPMLVFRFVKTVLRSEERRSIWPMANTSSAASGMNALDVGAERGCLGLPFDTEKQFGIIRNHPPQLLRGQSLFMQTLQENAKRFRRRRRPWLSRIARQDTSIDARRQDHVPDLLDGLYCVDGKAVHSAELHISARLRS